jgi:phenylpropionate dioxygenase-like ring-hydroxylating dioxygenase large terminal subunit
MLSEEDNRLLTETGPGTAMGALFRHFWMPVLLTRDLPRPDSAPLRLRILGEDFLALRFSDGRPGIIEPHCPHRGANLFFGRNEQWGIRCAYHGWKFDADGRCVDMPNMPSGPQRDAARERIRLRAYPTREWGDFVWAYFGPDPAPDLPQMEFALLPPSHRYVSKKLQECNWAQSCEGGLDTAHFSFLHMSVEGGDQIALDVMSRSEAAASGDTNRVRWIRDDGAPRFSIADHDVGLALGAARTADDGHLYWRISQFMMPNHGLAPNAFPGENYHGQCWVPIDDRHCWVFCYTWNPERPLSDAERDRFARGHTVHAEVDRTGLPLRNRSNDYLIDRDDQHLRSFTGIAGVSEQDSAIQDSQGFIADRTREHLGPTDLGIVRFRRLMLESARDAAAGTPPAAATKAAGYRLRAGGTVAPAVESFAEIMIKRFGDPVGRVGGIETHE